eukprot:scaffold24134_cov83-Skeletonema_dohrnii-CCMP3373.AAC.1
MADDMRMDGQDDRDNNQRRTNAAAQSIPDDEPALEGYARTDLIGQGAYGTVYRGTQRATNRTVAIKRIPYADSTPEGG